MVKVRGTPEQFDVNDTWKDACEKMWEWVKYLQAHYPVHFAILKMPPKLRNGDPGDYFNWLGSFVAVVSEQTKMMICTFPMVAAMASHLLAKFGQALADAVPKEEEG